MLNKVTETSVEEWTEFQGALNDKLVSVLQNLIYKEEQSLITKKELILACDTMFDSVSGIAHWDICDLIEKVKKEAQEC